GAFFVCHLLSRYASSASLTQMASCGAPRVYTRPSAKACSRSYRARGIRTVRRVCSPSSPLPLGLPRGLPECFLGITGFSSPLLVSLPGRPEIYHAIFSADKYSFLADDKLIIGRQEFILVRQKSGQYEEEFLETGEGMRIVPYTCVILGNFR